MRFQRTCAIGGCESIIEARGWCNMHYQRWRAHGDPLGRADRRVDDFERLATIDTDEHVLWPFAYGAGGYGRLQYNGGVDYAHRLALLRRVDMPPDRTFACHRTGIGCSKRCMNYRHLYWGTHADNMADGVVEGTSTRGERHPAHILTEADVREIRLHWDSGMSCAELGPMYGTSRQCITEIVQRRNWAWLE